jgi:iron-sulfur cluster repair protein YtfE (RIC family)
MSSHASEGSAYEPTQREHEQLRERIKFLHQRIDVRPASVDEIAKLLRELKEALVTHFRNEECEGFFDQIVTRAPQLSRQAQKLTHDHVDLLQQADALIHLAEQSAGEPICPATLAVRFHDFSKLLMRHESEENGMLQSAYQDDLGTKD